MCFCSWFGPSSLWSILVKRVETEVAEGQSENMWSNVPVTPGHQGQSAVCRLLHWYNCFGVTVLLWSILQAIVPFSWDYPFDICIPRW
jgi:hypothetical protein